MKYAILLLLFFMVFIISGCQSFGWGGSSDSGNAKLERELELQEARLRETSKMYENQMASINAKLNSMQDEYATLAARYNSLQRQVASVYESRQRLEHEITVVKQAIAEEKSARESALNKMAEAVAQETASAIKAVQKSASSSSSSSGGPVGSGKFAIYTVQPGATLSAIAKAYDVSVSDIKKANNLKSDIIRVGQKLYVPKK